MELLKKIDQVLMKFFNATMISANFILGTLILIGAFMRYILKKDFYGLEEIVLMIAFWMYFIGSAVATREDTQVSADLLSSAMKSEKAQAILSVVRSVITLILYVILMKWSFDYLKWSISMRPTTAVYKMPMAIAHASLFLSFLLSAVDELTHVIHAVVGVGKAFEKKAGGEKS